MRAPANEIERAAALAAPWMEVATRYRDLRERTPAGDLSPDVRAFFRHTRFPPELVNSHTAWCAAFVCACLELTGVRSPRSARARDFMTYGLELVRPVYGAVLVFARGLDPAKGHVGFASWPISPLGNVWCYGGNQDNAVCARAKPRGSLLSVRWPESAPLPVGAEVKHGTA